MDHCRLGYGRNFYRRMRFRCGCTPNKNGDVNIQTIELFGHIHHLVQRRSNESRQSDYIYLLFYRPLDDYFGRYHYPQIDDLIVITCQNHTYNILSYIVDISFYSSHQYFTCMLLLVFAFSSLDKGL